MVAAAVCPHPPLLVPDVASGAAPELDELRGACALAMCHLRDSGARSLLVIGAGGSDTAWQHPVTASFTALGVPLEFTLDNATAVAPRPLPVSLLVAAWLLRQSSMDSSVEVSLRSVPQDLPPERCATWRPDQDQPDFASTRPAGEAAPFDDAQPWALLAMGDGSARRSEKAPGYYDPRAEAFDATAAVALAAADTEALLTLDPALARQLWCAGRPAWQVLAGLVDADPRAWSGDLVYNEAPYGVTYLVATLAPAGNDGS